MNLLLAFIGGCFCGAIIAIYGLSVLIHGQATSYSPELVDRFEAEREAAPWN